MKCVFCKQNLIFFVDGIHKNCEPYIKFKGKNICEKCALEVVVPLYESNCGGGLMHVLFRELLSGKFNRKRKPTISNYRKIFNELLHKYNFKCVCCGSKEKLSVDHIKPVSKGGTDDITNLQILCKSCNSSKGAKLNG